MWPQVRSDMSPSVNVDISIQVHHGEWAASNTDPGVLYTKSQGLLRGLAAEMVLFELDARSPPKMVRY